MLLPAWCPCQILRAATACRVALPAANACAAGGLDGGRAPPQNPRLPLSGVGGALCQSLQELDLELRELPSPSHRGCVPAWPSWWGGGSR